MLTPSTTHKAFKAERYLGNRQGIKPSPMPQGIAQQEKRRDQSILSFSFNSRDCSKRCTPQNIEAAISFAQACLKALGEGESTREIAWRNVIVGYANRIAAGQLSVGEALEGMQGLAKG